MFSLIYFIPNVSKFKQETLNEFGLDYISKASITSGATTKAINNQPGFLFTHANSETKLGYRPESQTWQCIKVDEDKKFYIGYDNDAKPNLNEIIKKNVDLYDFFEYKLNDGEIYKFPRAQYIPQSFEFSPDGEIVSCLSLKYKTLIDVSQKYYKKFETGFKEENEEGIVEVKVDYMEMITDCSTLLNSFYKLGKSECILYKLFDTNNIFEILKKFLGYDRLEEILKEEQEHIEAQKKSIITE